MKLLVLSDDNKFSGLYKNVSISIYSILLTKRAKCNSVLVTANLASNQGNKPH